jgi:hypothetical protein
MLNEYNPIDDLFRKGLNNAEEYPQEFVWDKLSSGLSADKKKPYKKLWVGIAASIAMLMAFFSGMLITNIQKPVYLHVFPDTINDIPDHTLPREKTFPSGRTPLFMAMDKKNKEENGTKMKNRKAVLQKKEVSDGQDKKLRIPDGEYENNEKAAIEKENPDQEEAQFKKDEHIAGEEHIARQQEEFLPEDSLLYRKNLPVPPVQQEKKDRNWSLGLDVGPLYAYRSIRTTQNHAMMNSYQDRNDQKASYNAGEKPMIAYSGGCRLSLGINANWSIQSGIYYNKTGQVIDNVTLTRQIVSALDATEEDYIIHTSAGELTTKNEVWNHIDGNKELNIATYEEVISTEKDIHQTFSYLELPLLLRYTLWSRNIHLDLITGLSSAFLISNHSYLRENKSNSYIGATEGLQSVVYNGIAGIGLSSAIAEKLRFKLEPTFRLSLQPVNNAGDIKNYPFSLALYTGITYDF